MEAGSNNAFTKKKEGQKCSDANYRHISLLNNCSTYFNLLFITMLHITYSFN
jgi:hypothetical protein